MTQTKVNVEEFLWTGSCFHPVALADAEETHWWIDYHNNIYKGIIFSNETNTRDVTTHSNKFISTNMSH